MKHYLFLFLLSIACLTGCQRGIQKYDTLVDKDEICNQKWADYEAQLQRRSDLIPNLVQVVKASAAHENNTLKDVIEARAHAQQIKMSPEDFSDPEKLAAFQKAQSSLGGALSRLVMLQESYPDLKANQNFKDLQVQIEGTENRILRSRTEYNKAVQSYNLELRRVSGKVINPITGHEFKPRAYFSADANAKDAPKVDFNK